MDVSNCKLDAIPNAYSGHFNLFDACFTHACKIPLAHAYVFTRESKKHRAQSVLCPFHLQHSCVDLSGVVRKYHTYWFLSTCL